MNVIVCVKQIPDPAVPGALDGSTNTLKRDGKLILDDSDAYGVEMALQLVDKAGGGEVSLVSMAPNEETSGLRTAAPRRIRSPAVELRGSGTTWPRRKSRSASACETVSRFFSRPSPGSASVGIAISPAALPEGVPRSPRPAPHPAHRHGSGFQGAPGEA